MTKVKLDPLDNLFSEYIRRRAILRVEGCERCLTPKNDIYKDNGKIFPAWKQLQCSHFIGRSKKSTRWDEDNAAGFCGACHMYLSAHPAEHVRWFTERLGEEKMDLLMARVRERRQPDRAILTIYFREKIKEVG